MKQVKTLLILACLTIGFLSCKKQAATSTDTQAAIVGKWTYNKTVVDEYVNNVGPHNLVINNTDPTLYWQYNSDGTMQGSQKVSGVYVTTYGTYSISDNVLTMNANNAIEKDTIKQLTSTTLVLHKYTYSSGGGTSVKDFIDLYLNK